MRSVLPKLLLLTFTVLLMIAFGEFAVRILRPQDLSIWDITRDGIVYHHPNSETYLPKEDQLVRINGLGMRDYDREIQKAPGVYRVLVLGDSFMEAIQVELEDALPARLEAQLRDRSASEIEVVNISVSGWGSDDMLTFYERHTAAMDPDLVIVSMTLHNDLQDNQALEFHHLLDGELVARERRDLPLGEYSLYQVKRMLAANSHLYRLVYVTRTARSGIRSWKSLNRHVAGLMRHELPEDIRVAWSLTFQLFDKFDRVATERGADFAVFLIPLWIQTSDELLAEFAEDHDVPLEELRLDQPQHMMAAWSARSGVPVIDLLPDFREHVRQGGDSFYLPQDGHWNEAGHARASELVADALVRRFAIEGGSTAEEGARPSGAAREGAAPAKARVMTSAGAPAPAPAPPRERAATR